MNDYLKLIVASIAFSAIVIATAQDWDVGKINADQAKATLEAAGFTNVQGIRRDGTHWHANAVDKDGRRVSLDVDSKTGAFTQQYEKEVANAKHDHT